MHIYTLKLFDSFKMAYTCCFGFGFSRFPPKKFFSINYWKSFVGNRIRNAHASKIEMISRLRRREERRERESVSRNGES